MIGRPRHDFEHERLLAGDAVNLTDFRQLRQRLGELVVARLGRRVAADERRQFQAQQPAVELGGVTAHVAAIFQALDAIVDRGRFESYQRAEFGKRRAGVALKGLQQPQVKFVQLGGFNRYIRPFIHNPENYSVNRLYYTAFIRARGLSSDVRLKAAALATLLLMAGGCSAGGSVAPRPPGAVRFDLAADPANLNPLFLHRDSASVEQQVARLAFEPFIDLDSRGRLVPELLSRIPSV